MIFTLISILLGYAAGAASTTSTGLFCTCCISCCTGISAVWLEVTRVKLPAAAALPPVNYLEQNAAIAKAQLAIALSQEEISIKEQEIKELSQISDLDPILIEHEQAKLKQLQLNHQIAVNELELAQGKLQTAKQQRKYQEYLASITAARRVEEENQAKSFYQRQLAEYNEKIADKEIQVTQLQEKLNNVQNQIATLQVTFPYSGTVRNIEFLGQSPDGSIGVKITLMVKNS